MICLGVSTEYWRVTDRQTDRRTSCDSIVRAKNGLLTTDRALVFWQQEFFGVVITF